MATDEREPRIVALRAEDELAASPGPRGAVETRFLVISLAFASAVAAGYAGGHPTGISLWDAICRSALGFVAALAGTVCPWPFLVLSAVVLLAATVHSSAALVPIACLLIAGGGMWAGFRRAASPPSWLRPGPILTALRALVGLLLCQIALRLSWPSHPLYPSLVAAVAFGLLLIPALFCCPRPYRRWVAAASAVLLAAGVGLTALAGLSVLAAKSSLVDAVGSSQAGVAAARAGNQAGAVGSFASAETQFRAAGRDLSAARWAELVPGVAQQVRAVRAAARIGATVSSVARHTAARADLGSLRIDRGTFPLATLEALRPLLRRDFTALRLALRQSRAIRSPWLLSQIESKLGSETNKLREAEKAAQTAYRGMEVVPGLLGAKGPVRYLLLLEDPAESRASGGIVGEFAQVTADKGRLHLDRVGSVGYLNSSGDPATRTLRGPTGYIDRYSQFEPQDYWQNVPMSPDFPSVGEVAANLYPQSGGVPVEDVISLDPQAVASFLAVTGPISVPLWPTPISSSNVVPVLANTEFLHFAGNESAGTQFVQELVRALWSKLVSQPLPPIPSVINDLRPAIQGHSLLLYSQSTKAESFFRSVHIAGAMPRVRGDFLGVVTQNADGNKLDWYLRRTIDYHATVDFSTGAVTATVKVILRNLAPSSGLPAQVIDPSPGANTLPGENKLYVSIYTPWEDNGATFGGKTLDLSSQQELGRFVYSALVKVPARTSETLVLHLVGSWPRGLHHYHLGMFHQVVLFPDQVHTAVKVLGSWRKRSGGRSA